jgi:hypothetical protein
VKKATLFFDGHPREGPRDDVFKGGGDRGRERDARESKGREQRRGAARKPILEVGSEYETLLKRGDGGLSGGSISVLQKDMGDLNDVGVSA